MKSATRLLQVFSYWSAVVLRAKVAHVGDEVAPNECTVIQNSTGSPFSSGLSHQEPQEIAMFYVDLNLVKHA